jgi:uncharacterized protein YgiM (DUF1202 family)
VDSAGNWAPESSPVRVTVIAAEAYPGENATNLTEYYAAWGKSLPPLSERAEIYEALGLGTVSSYSGSSTQNNNLLNALKQRRICPSTGEEIGYVPSPPPASSGFNVGDNVRTTANLNVRSGPGLGYSTITTEPVGSTGIVLEGPANADGYVWWKIRYNDGTVGWSAEDWLEKI